MKIDAFLLNNELDLLELRLNVLDPVMDRFVVVESSVEFSGRKKPFYFADNRERFAPWKDKIRHLMVTDTPDSGANRWPREYHQRDAIIRGLSGSKSDDLVFMSDVDEIPDPDVVRRNGHGGYRQVYSMYYADAICMDENWVGTTAMYYFQYRQLGMQRARNDRYNMRIVQPGGWHFAYLMTPQQMHEKLKAFAHSEWDNPQIHSVLEDRVGSLHDLFGAHSQPMKVVGLQAGYFPQYLKDNASSGQKYSHFICGGSTGPMGKS